MKSLTTGLAELNNILRKLQRKAEKELRAREFLKKKNLTKEHPMENSMIRSEKYYICLSGTFRIWFTYCETLVPVFFFERKIRS